MKNIDKIKSKSNAPKQKSSITKRQKISIAIFAIGIIMMISGIIYLIISLTRGVSVQDAEYLTSVENWILQDEPNVIWDFTKIGEGTLTTNNHINDYDFKWAIKDGKLLIETDWLYALENEYDYELNQSAGTLVLRANDESYLFVAQR